METPNVTPGTHTLQFSQDEVAAIANIGSGSISFGPLKLSWDFSLSPLNASFSASLAGVSIGSVDINPSHPQATIGGSALGFKAEVTVTLNPSVPSVDYHVVVSTPFGPIVDKSGTVTL